MITEVLEGVNMIELAQRGHLSSGIMITEVSEGDNMMELDQGGHLD